MNKTKKNFFLKVAGLMAAVMMLTTCVVAGTMAKYTSSGGAKLPGLDAANWSIKAEDVNGTDGEKKLSEFTTSATNLTWTIEPIKTGTDNEAVDEGLIAPGTWGYAAIKITSESEVKVKVTIPELALPTGDNTSANLTFGYVYSTSELDNYAAMNAAKASANAVSGGTQQLEKNGTVYLYFFFEWQFDDADTHSADDTKIGEATSNTFTFGSGEITITAEQVEPEKNA